MSGLLRRVGATLAVLTGGVGAVLAGPAGAAVERVEMAGTRFDPARVEIEVGDTVIWEAADSSHTVTARDGSFDSSSRGAMAEGDQYRWRFRIPGTYRYFCRVHQSRGMQGMVVVVDPDAPTTTTSRLTPVTAAATTSTAPTTTTTAAPTTTTTRVLATSSTTSRSIATATTEPSGTPLIPQAPPALNPAAPVVGGGADAFAEARAATGEGEGQDDPTPYLVAVGLLVALAAAGAGSAALRRRRAEG